MTSADEFDAVAKEAVLAAEAVSWDVSVTFPAEANEIPVIDIGAWLETGDHQALVECGEAVRIACETVGFFQLRGHGLQEHEIFEWTKRFHTIPTETKEFIHIDNPLHPLKGVGYLPIGERRLPRREKGNRNEAFLIKHDKTINFGDNQWLDDTILPGFLGAVQDFATEIERVAKNLVQVYAVALDLAPDYFEEAMSEPFWRLRLTHYPPHQNGLGHGIAPHVDTSFFTLLLQDSPGLVVNRNTRWIRVPYLPGTLLVNTGELLRQWSNDRFVSARHFADNTGDKSRYSIPFFFNASGDFVMECLPTCAGPNNPPKYPSISYNQSQAVVQGE